MTTAQLPLYLNQETACISVAIGILDTIRSGEEVTKAFFCPKGERLIDCLTDAAATYRLRKGVAPHYCVCNRATAEALAGQTTGIKVFVGSDDWPRDREMYLGVSQ